MPVRCIDQEAVLRRHSLEDRVPGSRSRSGRLRGQAGRLETPILVPTRFLKPSRVDASRPTCRQIARNQRGCRQQRKHAGVGDRICRRYSIQRAAKNSSRRKTQRKTHHQADSRQRESFAQDSRGTWREDAPRAMWRPSSRIRRRMSNETTAYWPIAAIKSEPPANNISSIVSARIGQLRSRSAHPTTA